MQLTAEMGGNGFGNEFIKLAKLLICRRELGFPIAPSYWRSPYRKALPKGLCYTSRTRRALRHLSTRSVEFGKTEHVATGYTAVERALSAFIKTRGLSKDDPCLINFTGFDPGLDVVEHQGPFLHKTLITAPLIRQGLNHRTRVFDRRKLQVGVHIRQGDFRPALPLGVAWPEGQWNIQIPVEWYDRICSRLQAAFSGRIQFYVTTNGTDPDVISLCEKYDAVLARGGAGRRSPDIADMLALAECDVLIGSASWFSGWPAVLSPKPWLWYPCAHGEPPWAKQTASLYLNEPELPCRFMEEVEAALGLKNKGGRS